jgi:NADH-quinone oxidoreductase subunit L
MDPKTLELVAWLVPLLPFGGFVINVFLGKQLPKPVVSLIACGTVLGSAICAWTLFAHVHATHKEFATTAIAWIRVPGLGADGAFMKVIADHKLVVDQLTCVMILVVTNVGFLIHLYSTGYMAEEKRYSRYFAYLNLFTGFMLVLVMGGNLFLMFVGWEGVGLCSYLLISFWYEKVENAKAGMKAFVVNRVGDFAFTIGVLLLFVYVGTMVDKNGTPVGKWTIDFGELRALITDPKNAVSTSVMTAVGILLFIGATGKSAQIPLYTWLPDAMAGPTPVSALIHAATMVTAGVYMIARTNFIFALSPTAMTVVALVGGLTALFAGTIGIAQNDIKKVLAYSTVSQLGFMFMGVGVGAFAAGIFHLMTHAFFKACLFLGSGSVIHGMGGEQDIRKMGGLRKYMPITFATFAIASLAIAGFPFLAGFWSKDEILWKAFSAHGLGLPVPFTQSTLPIPGPVIWGLGAIAALCTAFYMTRLVVVTFFGELRSAPAAHAHSGGGAGLPDWMDDEEKKKEQDKPKDEPVPPPPSAVPHDADDSAKAAGGKPPSDLPDWMKEEEKHDAPAHDEHKPEHHDEHAKHDDAGHHDDAGGHGHGHEHAGTPHESPWTMTLPLVVLAVLSIVGGFIGMGAWTHMPNHFEHWLEPVCPDATGAHHAAAAEAAHGTPAGENKEKKHDVPLAEYVMVGVSIVIGLTGIFYGWRVYQSQGGKPAQKFAEENRELYELVRDKYRVDELYDAIAVEPVLELNEQLARFDNAIVDGAVNGAASVGATASNYTGYFDNEVVDGGVNATAHAVQATGRAARQIQTGNIRAYLTSAVIGGLVVIGAYCVYLRWEEISRFFKAN